MLTYIYLDFGWALSPVVETSFFFICTHGTQLDAFVCVPDVEKLRQAK